MKWLLKLTLLAGVALLYGGCAHSSVKLRDTLGSKAPKGFAEFYVGVTCEKFEKLGSECHLSVSRLGSQEVQKCGEATGHFHGGTRLRVACAPGANEFVLSPSFIQGATNSESKRVVVNIVEGQVTPVRVMVSVLSISETMQNSISTIEWLFKWDVAAGEPQPYYDLASLNHAFEESFGLTDWGRFGKMFIEGKDMREVQDTKLRIDRALVGLNLSEARDRTELLRRYYQDRPKENAPRGVLVRILLIEKHYSGALMLAFE